jgi:hypothetical protein
MTTFSEPKTEQPINKPTRDQKEAESRRRRAECAERISRLLSALDGGSASCKTEQPPEQAISGKTEHLPEQAIRETKTNPQSDTAQRFLLVDRNGPIGEFDSWEDANRYKNDLHHSGANIINVAINPLKPGAGREQPAQQPPAQQPPAQQQPTQQQPTQQQPTQQQATQQQATLQQPTDQAASTAGLNSPTPNTMQELKKADEAGESKPNPVREGSAPPAKPTRIRIVGRIFPAAARTVTLNACPKLPADRYELLVLGNAVAQNTNMDGFGNLTLNCAPQDARHETINIHYTTE